MDKDNYVYALFRPDNGQIFYIGMGRGQRAWRHVILRKRGKTHKNAVINKLIDKLGYSDIPVVIIRDGLTRGEAIDLEIALIYAIGRSPHGPLTNGTRGGDGLHDPSRATRKKMSKGLKERHKGEWGQRCIKALNSPEARAKPRTWMKGRSPYNKGKKLSEEHRVKLSLSHKGTKHSEEHKAKIGAASKGRKDSAETRAKKSAAQLGNTHCRGRKHSEETKAKMSSTHNGKMYITDGASTRSLAKGSSIPDGWRRGRH